MSDAEHEPQGTDGEPTPSRTDQVTESEPTPSRAEQVAALRPRYQADLARGLDRFFEPRRADCPWCGSARLKTRLRTTDLLQHKPGHFVLDHCQDCRHTFQNPD